MQVENEHYSILSGLIRLVISLECFVEITPDFLCPFMNDWTTCTVNFRATVFSYSCLNIYNSPYAIMFVFYLCLPQYRDLEGSETFNGDCAAMGTGVMCACISLLWVLFMLSINYNIYFPVCL